MTAAHPGRAVTRGEPGGAVLLSRHPILERGAVARGTEAGARGRSGRPGAPPPRAGRETAVENRDTLAAKMTPEQIAEAQRLAREWQPKR